MKKYINLLPPAEQKQFKLVKVRLLFLHFAWFLVGSVIVLCLLLLGADFWLRRELNDVTRQVETQSEALQKIKSSRLSEQAERLNLSLENFQILKSSRQSWSKIFMELASILPQNITLDNVAVNRSDKKIEISGRAGSRESVLALRRKILESAYFVNVNFPLSNLEKAQNVPFKYRFYYKPELLLP